MSTRFEIEEKEAISAYNRSRRKVVDYFKQLH